MLFNLMFTLKLSLVITFKICLIFSVSGGKFGQRLNLKQSQFLHETVVDRFYQLLTDSTKEMQDFHIISDDIVQLQWTYQNTFIPEGRNTNIYLATFTTCWARLKLYDILQTLDTRVIYYDTDSIVYISRPGYDEPSLGDFLGELTNELDNNDYIETFVSGGPKNYAYRTHLGQEVCKVRGFTLNYTNSQLINFEAVKNIVTAPKHEEPVKSGKRKRETVKTKFGLK